MRGFSLLVTFALLLSACTGVSANDRNAFAYRGHGSGQFDVRFVSPDDRMLVVERDGTTWDGTARLDRRQRSGALAFLVGWPAYDGAWKVRPHG